MEIIQIPVWTDNYAYLICEDGEAALVDSPEAAPVQEVLEARHLVLKAIWNTHHHFDHVGSNQELVNAYHPVVAGYIQDANRIPGFTWKLKEGDQVEIGGHTASVIFVPGHTSGHISYFFEKENALFCGDTLFAGGCGRLFEGTAKQMYESLRKLAALPDSTLLYCAHEYTFSNLRFALTIEPSNEDLKERFERVRVLREEGKPTVPSTLGEEKATNPFLRVDSAEVIRAAKERGGAVSDDPVAVFAAIRSLKDRFS